MNRSDRTNHVNGTNGFYDGDALLSDTEYGDTGNRDQYHKNMRQYDKRNDEEETALAVAVNNDQNFDSNNSGTPPPPDDNERDAPSATTRRKQLQDELVQRIIADAKNNRSVVIQLKNKGIIKLPDELLHLSHIEVRYISN